MRKPVLFLSILALTAILVAFLVFRFISTPKALEARIGNVSARAASIAWVSKGPVRACAYIYPKGKIFQAKAFCDYNKSSSHLIDFSPLAPESRYRVFLTNGARLITDPALTITTPKIREGEPPAPDPAYGTVVDGDGKAYLDAIIVAYPSQGEIKNYLLAKPNGQGNYAFDFANFPSMNDSYTLEALGSSGSLVKVDVGSGYQKPLPTMVVGGNE